TTRALFNAYLQASHQRRPSVLIWLPGKAARAVRAGANLAPDRAVGQRTWEAFLSERVGVASASAPRVA
ncbi:MAG: NAD-dependent epimerase/dehydratase family protein, partial [Ktedonobacterales bacterium]